MTETAQAYHPAVRVIPLEAGGEVEFRLSSHELRMRAVDGDKVVIRSRGDDDLERHLEIQSGPGFVRVLDGPAGSWRIGPITMRSGHTPDLEVEIPRNVRVAVRTISGDITAVGIGGSSRWMTASGDVRLGLNAGPVTVEAVSGDVRIEASCDLDVTARTVSGDVRVRASRITAVDAVTTSGDIEIDGALAEGGRHNFVSVSGDVRLITGSEIRVETQSVAGDIHAALAHRSEGTLGRRVVTIGSGRVRVSVKTMSGDVDVQPGSPDPVPPMVMPDPTPKTPRSEVRWGSATASAAGAAVSDTPAAPVAARPADAPEASRPDVEAQRLEILRALERGELDVETAWSRLDGLDGTPVAE